MVLVAISPLMEIAHAQFKSPDQRARSGSVRFNAVTTGSLTLSNPASAQGNGSKIQLSTGTTTTGNYVAWDANGNTVTATGVNALPAVLEHTQTISTATNYALQSAQVTSEVLTFSASATVTLPQATVAGQTLNAIVCQNGTGGFTPTFAAIGGLTITGTFPTFTTTASKCGVFSLHYTTTTQAYLVGSIAGPL